ncbi:IS21 family transposase [Acinetobacter sp. YH16032]|uniref:IS21 family transposase n=1 Tax=Acinetobacter sp. YH16032 TaxID=2601181 RepID=UPI0015D379C9|nr:IS21 family transposase [Acinetobacter sp. YH16032]
MNTSIEKIRLVISYIFSHKSNREIAKIVEISRETVSKIKSLLILTELTYEDFTKLNNSELEQKLKINRSIKRIKKSQPDCEAICSELATYKGLTKAILWEEYRLKTHGNGVGYTRFCELIKQAQKQKDIPMKQEYYPGEIVQIDYSGDLVDIDLFNGDVINANIFVGALPCSSLIFAYATESQKTEDWIRGCSQMFDKIDGIPQTIVCDNAKALITKHRNRIVEVNPYFQEFLEFHKINVLPARPRKPRDKAVSENAVNIVQKQILMRIRHEKFTSIKALNERLEYMVDCYNHKKTKTFPQGRMAIFLEHEKKLLRPLPLIKYKVLNEYSKTIVPSDYHVKYLNNSYSVPHQYIREKVELKILDNQLYIYQDKKLIAQHTLLQGEGKISTFYEHKTENHRTTDYLSKESILNWSQSIGTNTFNYCNMIICKNSNLYNNLNYLFDFRSWVNSKQFIDRLEQALCYAYKLKIENLARLKSIIESRSYLEFDQQDVVKEHKNLRGSSYYKGDK